VCLFMLSVQVSTPRTFGSARVIVFDEVLTCGGTRQSQRTSPIGHSLDAKPHAGGPACVLAKAIHGDGSLPGLRCDLAPRVDFDVI
jgi:hypothetical protein